jgi:hypothetical protein
MRFASYRQNGILGLAAAVDARNQFYGMLATDVNYPGDLARLIEAGGDKLTAAGKKLLTEPESPSFG